MKLLYEKLKTTRSILTVLLLGIFLLAATVVQAASVTTDKNDYSPGETVYITGTGFQAGEEVALNISHANFDPNHQHNAIIWYETADANGNFTSAWLVSLEELGTTLILTADGLSSGLHAQTIFTDTNEAYTWSYDASNSCIQLVATNLRDWCYKVVVTEPTTSYSNTITFVGTTNGTATICFTITTYGVTYSSQIYKDQHCNGNWVPEGVNGSDSHPIPLPCIPPSITCPENITQNNDLGLCSASVTFAATATGTTPTITYTIGTTPITSPYVFNVGTIEVSATASNTCGTASCTFTVTVLDKEAPVISPAASNMTVECDGTGNSTQLNNWLTSHGGASATDNCDQSLTWTYSPNPAILSDLCGATGAVTVTFTVSDDDGNSSTTVATFTIVDTTPPALTNCTDRSEIVECLGAAGNETYADNWDAANIVALSSCATDICGGIDAITGNFNFANMTDGCGETGSLTARYTVWDECGNSSSVSYTLTFIDTTPPTIGTPAANKTVECDGAGNTADLEAWLDNNGGAVATDVCGGVTWSNDFTALSDDCGATGSAYVTFTATDDCGNTTTTAATFTIEDTTAPSMDTQAANETVECDGAGNTADLEAWLDNNGGAVATDVCGGVTWSNDFTELSDDCGATGSAYVTFTATDDCGNTATTAATFTIEDTTAPSMDTQAANETVECDGAGNTADLEAWLDNNGGAVATDVCGGVTWSNDFTELSDDCGATGSAYVTFTATDDCGNTVTTAATFTIEDTTAPSMDTQAANETVECDGAGNVAELNAWLADNGGAEAEDVCGGVTWSNNFTGLSADCGATGTAYVTFTATDNCGNTTTTAASFTIEDTLAPSMDTQAANETIQCDGDGNTEELEEWLDNNGGAIVSDDCSSVTWSNDFVALSIGCGATGSATVTFTATDDCGNASTTVATFTIVDTTDPIWTVAPEDMTVECDGAGNTASLTAWLAAPNGGDVCGSAAVTNNFTGLTGGCGHTGSATVTFTLTDECGNDITKVATFTIIDTTPPVIVCKANQTKATDKGLCTYKAQGAEFDATASDVCSSYSLTYVLSGATTGSGTGTLDGVDFNFGETLVTWTATDDCGNKSSCSSKVNVNMVTTSLVVTVSPSPQQYSDPVTFTATLTPWNCPLVGCPAAGKVEFKVGTLVMTVPLGSNGVTTLTTNLCGDFGTTLGTYNVYATFIPDPIACPYYLASSATCSNCLTITPEAVCVYYSGVLVASTTDPNSDRFKVVLAATIKDPDTNNCDLTKAKVVFYVNGSAVNAGAPAPVGLVNASDQSTGTAIFEWSSTVPTAGYATYEITIGLVGNYYARDASCSDGITPITVSKPMGEFITGGGYLVLTTATNGIKAGDVGSKNNFGFNVKWNKSLKNLQGNINTIIRRTESDGLIHNWQVKGNAMSSLTVDAVKKEATFTGKATLKDVSELPIDKLLSGDGNATLQVIMKDVAEPGKDLDLLGVTVWNKSGGVWFTSNWNGIKTVWQTIAKGNLQVQPSALKSAGEVVINSSNFVKSELLVYPNPFSDKLRFEFVSPSDTHARINLYDLTGRLVQTVFDNEVKAGIDYNADFTPSTNVSGMYFYRMTLGEQVFNGKVMYKQ